MGTGDQLGLFPPGVLEPTDGQEHPASGRRQRGPVRPAAVNDSVRRLAAALPRDIRLGTSSWSFGGWVGIVYDREVSQAKLAHEGLPTYAQHPLLRTVCIDRTFYKPVEAEVFARYAAEVSDDFRFVVKAHEHCTLRWFPRGRRYSAFAGERCPTYLDPAYATDHVVQPAVTGLGDKLGPILFQFPPQSIDALGGPKGFADDVHDFLRRLPRGPVYAIEIRNWRLLSEPYAEALRDVGAVHCLVRHPRMPPISEQAALFPVFPGSCLLVRWMLGKGLGYDEARERYAPFDRVVDPDLDTRKAVAALCVDAASSGTSAFVIANNKAEGSAPKTLEELARAIVRVPR